MQWLHFPQIASTHLFAKHYARRLIDQRRNIKAHTPCFQIKALITCDEQTDGIGRRGNRWQSCQGDLLASYLVDLSTNWLCELSGQIALASACALFDALAPLLGDSMRNIWIKWPNDLYSNDRKVAGVMAEQIDGGKMAIVSVGVNLAKKDELAHLQPAPAIALERRGQICPCQLLQQMTGTLTSHFQRLYRRRELDLKPIHFGNRLVLGTAISFCFSHDETRRHRALYRGIDRFGRLIALWRDHLLHLRSEQICKLQIASS